MQRYFIKSKEGNNYNFYEKDIHHIKKVMRNKIGDKIEIVYQQKVSLCELISIEPIDIKIIETYEEDREIPIELTIAVALVQEQKFDLIIQKLTELGVTKIIPVKTQRSIVQLDNKKELKKIERWQTIAKEASEQSHRINIPEITPIKTIKELNTIKGQLKLICSLSEKTEHISTYLTSDINDILFIIGPEGGFTEEEEKELLKNEFKPITLGKRVMRVETAAIYVASIINYVYRG